MNKALRLEKTCPKCGSNLMLREGENGDFLACPKFPGCRYTESIPDGNAPLFFRTEASKYCKKCNRTGLLPFVKEGRVVPNAYLNCECRVVDESYHYLNIDTDAFDFPMSGHYREFTFEQYGRPWEQRSEIYQPEEPPEPIEIDPVDSQEIAQLNRRHQYQIDQTRSEIKRLTMKVAAMTGEKSKPAQPEQPEKSAYKGLVVKND